MHSFIKKVNTSYSSPVGSFMTWAKITNEINFDLSVFSFAISPYEKNADLNNLHSKLFCY